MRLHGLGAKGLPQQFGPTIRNLGRFEAPVGQVLSAVKAGTTLRLASPCATSPNRLVLFRDGQPCEPIVTNDVKRSGSCALLTSKEGARYVEYSMRLPVDDFESLVNGLRFRYKTVNSQGIFSRERHMAKFDETELAS